MDKEIKRKIIELDSKMKMLDLIRKNIDSEKTSYSKLKHIIEAAENGDWKMSEFIISKISDKIVGLDIEIQEKIKIQIESFKKEIDSCFERNEDGK